MAALDALFATVRSRSLRLAAVAALLLALAVPRPAGAAPAPADSAHARPRPRLELGFEERDRTENWDNSTDFNRHTLDARHQWRFRTRAWARLTPDPATEIAVGLANESRKLTTPRIALQLDETVFETLYLDHRFPAGVAVRLGRQNITKGDGFLLTDGSPLDGSRVAYMNAADVSWTCGKDRLDLLAIADPYRDHYLPPFHDRKKSLIEWDESALGLYWSDAAHAGTTIDAYWFFKAQIHDTRARTSVAYQGDRRFHTLGGRVTSDRAHGWSLKAELAGQLGTQPEDRDIRAWGTQLSVKKSFAHASKPSLLLGWTGLSGDDPRTPANEGWDPLFSRYPKWSELYIYTLASEHGAAYWTNLSMFQGELRLTPVKSLDLRGTYYRMGSFHRFPGKAAIYGPGSVRGDLYEARADYKLNDSWRGHVVGEWLAPGGFYTGGDPGWFFRAEVMYSFKHVFAL